MIGRNRSSPALLAALFIFLCWRLAAANDETPLHHDLDVRLDVSSRQIAILDRIRIKGQGPITLQLAPLFQITSLSVDGQKANYRRDDNAWLVDLGKALEHQVVVEYSGLLPPPPDPTRRSAKDSPFASPLDQPFASPEGSYLPDLAGWRSSLDGRAFTYRLTVSVQAPNQTPNQAVAPGRLVEEETKNGVYRAVFESTGPARELILLAGPYAIAEKFSGGVRLRAYFHQSIAPLAEDYLNAAAAYLDRYRQQIGDYPFSAFYIVSGPLPVGLGYAGLTYMGVDVLRLPFIRQRSLGHEVAHSWFGNGIYIDYRGGNWGEGLTTFMADYAFALDEGLEKGRQMRLDWLMAYAALPAGRDRPAAAFMGKTHGASEVIGYGKVAFFFHMLRRELGEQAFFAAIRRFWGAKKFQDAAWHDLRQAFEAAADRPLKYFFDQWLTRAGAPTLKLEAAAVEPANGRFRITFAVSQNDPVYIMKLPVKITTESGEEWFEVALNRRRSSHELFTTSRPAVLALDPNFDLFRRLDAEETPPILRDVTLKTGAVALILDEDEKTAGAARQLAERLMDAPPAFAAYTGGGLPDAPLLIIGAAEKVDALLGAAKLDLAPEGLALSANANATASVWASRRPGNQQVSQQGSRQEKWPLLVIAAKDAAAIEALHRPLPHYGREGFLLFEGSRAVKRGILPPAARPLTRALSGQK